MDGYYEMGKKKEWDRTADFEHSANKNRAIYVRERHKTVADVPQMEPK